MLSPSPTWRPLRILRMGAVAPELRFRESGCGCLQYRVATRPHHLADLAPKPCGPSCLAQRASSCCIENRQKKGRTSQRPNGSPKGRAWDGLGVWRRPDEDQVVLRTPCALRDSKSPYRRAIEASQSYMARPPDLEP